MITKFRAWDKKKNEMFNVIAINMKLKRVYETWNEDGMNLFAPLDSTILMQSTGLHDVNGKEIFEGDVVKFSIEHDGLSKPPRNIKYEIVIEDMVTLIKNAEHKLVLRMVNEDMEIIGNIHEHNHLLDDGGQ